MPVSLFAQELPEVEIPSTQDWTDHGVVLQQSFSGWDRHFAGFIPSVVKKDDIYFLYYVGSSGPRSSDGKPRDRALGVATSTDGIHFTKYAGNPVLTFQPHNNEEEGVWSVATALDDNGDIVLFYGGLLAANSSSTQVDVNIYLATSSDGLNLTDMGLVLSSSENGGENTPLAVIYAPGGTPQAFGNWHLWYGRKDPTSLAMGDNPSTISRVASFPLSISVGWLGMAATRIGGGKVAVFVDEPLEVWVAYLNALDQFQGPLSTFDLPSFAQGKSVVLDRVTNTWYLYFHQGMNNDLSDVDTIHVWTAPVRLVPNNADSLSPEAPANLVVK